MKKHRVTAKDVARLAGVSPTTVSMILNGRSDYKFSESTYRRVIDACKELDYERPMSADLSRLEGKVLLALTPTFSNLYYIHMLEAMQIRAKELGYYLLTFNTFREISQESLIVQLCNSLSVSGIFFLYPLENSLLATNLGISKPTVHIYDKAMTNDADTLLLDGFRIGELIAEHLISLGHERIALITSTLDTKQLTRIRRLEGLRSVYRAHGYDPEKSVLACSPETELGNLKKIPEGYDLGYLVSYQLITRGEPVTAFVSINDMIAVGIMDAITDLGYSIPGDYSVCGCDNISLCRYRGISLTSVESYGQTTGREAVDILVRKIEDIRNSINPGADPEGVTHLEYFPKLVVRSSTGPRKR